MPIPQMSMPAAEPPEQLAEFTPDQIKQMAAFGITQVPQLIGLMQLIGAKVRDPQEADRIAEAQALQAHQIMLRQNQLRDAQGSLPESGSSNPRTGEWVRTKDEPNQYGQPNPGAFTHSQGRASPPGEFYAPIDNSPTGTQRDNDYYGYQNYKASNIKALAAQAAAKLHADNQSLLESPNGYADPNSLNVQQQDLAQRGWANGRRYQ